jgi:hypothetical protein
MFAVGLDFSFLAAEPDEKSEGFIFDDVMLGLNHKFGPMPGGLIGVLI